MLDKIRRYIQLNNMLVTGESVVVGVSGGADSMCLLSVLLELNVKVYVVHINHGLRGKAANEDMVYVENFCKDRGIECYTFSYDVEKLAKDKGMSCEEAGRMVRYEAFYQIMKKTGSTKIAVAHNAGDNAETILHNLFRGTGIKGLVGILPTREDIIRPLLCVERSEIENYLTERHIDYCNDITNSQDIYTRNKIRNKVIPYITENINRNVISHINMTGRMLSDIDEYISIEGSRIFMEVVEFDCKKVQINVNRFTSLHKVMMAYIIRKAIMTVTESLKDVSYTHIESVINLFESEVGKRVNLPYAIVAQKTYNTVDICVQEPANIEKTDEEVYIEIRTFGEFLLNESGKKLTVSAFSKEEWDKLSDKYEEKMYTKWLDCDILDRNLVIRTRRTGDYIIVDDNGSKKKIKDLFIDIKLPREQRDKVLLLANGSEILWIIGYRINYNYRVTEGTKDIIKLEYQE